MISTLPIGSCVDRYQIQGVLGKGGFGITYVAVDTQIGLRVAIKELLPDTIATRAEGATVIPQTESMWENWQWARDRFVEEAQILAGFSHPAIVGIHSLLEANGTVYMVMDLVDGESYEARLKRIGREQDQESLMQIFEPILDGLQEVHSKNLLHRDIKPENILVGSMGQPVLIDFGSARTSIGATMTMTSIVTHGYSPIEQYQTKGRMGPWTDIYALGAVMCLAISGEKPPVAADRIVQDDFAWLSYRGLEEYEETFLQAVDWALRVRSDERPPDLAAWKSYLKKDREPKASRRSVPFGDRAPEDQQPITRLVAHTPMTKSSQPPGGGTRTTWDFPWWGVVAMGAGLGLMFGDYSLFTGSTLATPVAPVLPVAQKSSTVVESAMKPTPAATVDFEQLPASAPTPTPGVLDDFVLVVGGTLPENSHLAGSKVKSFYLGRTEVTWREWQRVRDWAANHGYDIADVGVGSDNDHPVRNVNLYDCVMWCNALSEMEGLTPVYRANGSVYRSRALSIYDVTDLVGADGYRLPTEAEWEWAACGAGKRRGYKYSGSDNLNWVGWYAGNSGGTTQAVAKLISNELGLYDMSGNLWEWCWDSLDKPNGTTRGGSWHDSADSCSVFCRIADDPNYRSPFNGLRLARSL